MKKVFFVTAILVAMSVPLRSSPAQENPATASPAVTMTAPPDKIAPPMATSGAVGNKGAMINSEGGGAIPTLPLQPYISNGIQYVSGGIGDEEMAQLKSVEQDYNVHVMLSSKDGAYVAKVSLRMLNAQGQEVLLVNNAGPFVYIKLPAGGYTLEATRNGETRKANVKVPASGAAKPHFTFQE